MTLTFQDILTRFASQAQVALDADTGLPTLSRQEEHRFTQYLNEAAAWVWRGKFDRWTFPELITGKTVTLGASGLITAATLDNATFWSVWDTDPRNAQVTERQRLQLRATAKGNGDLLVDEGAAGNTVFVIYRTRVPKWTAVLASGYASTVSVETRLWNKLCGTDGDGEVYRERQPRRLHRHHRMGTRQPRRNPPRNPRRQSHGHQTPQRRPARHRRPP
jgi:hypothetical protein